MNGREGGLSRLLQTGINLLWIEQAAVIAQLECMGKKAALRIEQFEGFTSFGIVKTLLDERDWITSPARQGLLTECGHDLISQKLVGW
jgi:hypothetical protein